MAILVKKATEKHFIKDFNGGTTSDRLILPGPDGCRMKATMFHGKKGFEALDIFYGYDEFVFIQSGAINLYSNGSCERLKAGDMYYVPANNHYGLQVVSDVEAICVFTSAADGTLPDDE